MLYWIIRYFTKGIFKIFYDFKIYGAENIPEKGPYLICANHCSFLDPLVICDAIPSRVWWVIIKDLYEVWPLSILLRCVRCIPVNGATKEALNALKHGKIIGIFPEGRRTYTGILMHRGKKGAALLAMRAGVPVLPAWISGAFEAYPRRAMFPKIYPIRICFEKPLMFDKHEEKVIDENLLKAATEKIMFSIVSAKENLQIV